MLQFRDSESSEKSEGETSANRLNLLRSLKKSSAGLLEVQKGKETGLESLIKIQMNKRVGESVKDAILIIRNVTFVFTLEVKSRNFLEVVR